MPRPRTLSGYFPLHIGYGSRYSINNVIMPIVILMSISITPFVVGCLTGVNAANSNNGIRSDSTCNARGLDRAFIGPLPHIETLKAYHETTSTDKFISGQDILVRCNVTHPYSYENITGAFIKIYNEDKNISLLPSTSMNMEIDEYGAKYIWFKYIFSFPIPTPRGKYNVTIEVQDNSELDPPDKPVTNETITIRVLNSKPEIKGTIGPIYKSEDDLPWVLDMFRNKTDLEDYGDNLIWHVENLNESLLSVNITGDKLTFNHQPDTSGSNKIKLVLQDSDLDSASLNFMVHVLPVNDPPRLIKPIPNQIRVEDSIGSWVINLTTYGYDVEDSTAHKLLTWLVYDINLTLIEVKIIRNITSNLMVITPGKDMFGANYITIRAYDSQGLSIAQRVWVNVTPDNDPPWWKPIPHLYLESERAVNILNLADYIIDPDTRPDEISYGIRIGTSKFIKSGVDKKGMLSIEISDPDYTGPGVVEVFANDTDNEVSTKINITIFLGKFTVNLLAPENRSIITENVPRLYWNLNNPANLQPIYFDVYLHENPEFVINHKQDKWGAHNLTENSHISYFELKNNVVYYWTVVPKYFDENGKLYVGETLEGIRNFRISTNANNQPPISVLISPSKNEIIRTREVNLSWFGFDPDNDLPITYELYFSSLKNEVEDRLESAKIELSRPTQNNFSIGDLQDNQIFYWTVIPKTGNYKGTCISGTNAFGVDLENTEPCTMLVLPRDRTVVNKLPILYWEFIDPDPFEDIKFDIYFNENRFKVESLDQTAKIATLEKTTNYYVPTAWKSNKKYYWTVIGYDRGGTGICESGIWSFTIDETQSNYPPVAQLLDPKDKLIIHNSKIELVWNGTDRDNDGITYTLYFGDDYIAISNLNAKFKYLSTKKQSFIIENLEDRKTYYWTVVPDDDKVSGICLNTIWSFEVELDNTDASNGEDGANSLLMNWQIIGLVIGLIILFITITIVYRRNQSSKHIKEYLKTGSTKHMPRNLKDQLISHSMLKALHAKEKELEEIEAGTDKKADLRGIPPSQPYHEGDYDHSVEKSRYLLNHSNSKTAEPIKRAIPYAKGENHEAFVSSNEDFELAKPLLKKIASEKAIKASSLPITKECPRCGSFKVKTYKDDTSKCLDCKFKF